MIQLEQLLGGHRFFEGLDPKYLALLAGCSMNKRFEAGQYLCRVGEEANCFYVIRHGLVVLESSLAGGPAAPVQTLAEGDVLGWSWLVEPHRWHFDARAEQPTVAMSLDGKCLRAKCEADPKLGFELLKRFTKILAQRLEATRLDALEARAAAGRLSNESTQP